MLETTAETLNDASKTTSKIDDENRIEKQFMSSQAFHRTPGGRVRETIVEEQFKPQIIESFDPMTEELYQHLPVIIHTEIHAKNQNF
jgi:hypothetical protein